MSAFPAQPEMCGVRGVGTDVDDEFGLPDERCYSLGATDSRVGSQQRTINFQSRRSFLSSKSVVLDFLVGCLRPWLTGDH